MGRAIPKLIDRNENCGLVAVAGTRQFMSGLPECLGGLVGVRVGKLLAQAIRVGLIARAGGIVIDDMLGECLEKGVVPMSEVAVAERWEDEPLGVRRAVLQPWKNTRFQER